MKFIPILFSKPMVQAINGNLKTQTRREIKPTTSEAITLLINLNAGVDVERCKKELLNTHKTQPGDIFWVRETWANTTNVNQKEDEKWPNRPCIITDAEEGEIYSAVIWRADGPWNWVDEDGFDTEKSYWKPSIFMPKAACRIFLEVTDVRVERVQDISEADTIAEGIEDFWKDCDGKIGAYRNYLATKVEIKKDHWAHVADSAKHSFETLWQSINGRKSWDANPWVWVYSFKRIDKPSNFI